MRSFLIRFRQNGPPSRPTIASESILLIKQVISQANFATTLRVATDGERAQQLLADPVFKPALIILDLNIPKVLRLELLERSHLAVAVGPTFRENRLRAVARP
jgi:hypothetical protein